MAADQTPHIAPRGPSPEVRAAVRAHMEERMRALLADRGLTEEQMDTLMDELDRIADETVEKLRAHRA